MIKIDSHIPPPPMGRDGRTMEREATERLGVGDSYYSPKGGKIVRPLVWAVSQKTGRKFTTRKEGSGVRVWRVE